MSFKTKKVTRVCTRNSINHLVSCKRSVLGSIMIIFVSTIIIILILVVFALMSAFVKKESGNYDGTVAKTEKEAGILDSKQYSSLFGRLAALKFMLSQSSDSIVSEYKMQLNNLPWKTNFFDLYDAMAKWEKEGSLIVGDMVLFLPFVRGSMSSIAKFQRKSKDFSEQDLQFNLFYCVDPTCNYLASFSPTIQQIIGKINEAESLSFSFSPYDIELKLFQNPLERLP